jgi:hypothetical protein
MKNKSSAILCGVSTLALAMALFSNGAFAEDTDALARMKTKKAHAATLKKTKKKAKRSAKPALKPATRAHAKSQAAAQNAAGVAAPVPRARVHAQAPRVERTDAIVTSAASANSIAAESSTELRTQGAGSVLSNFSLRLDSVWYGGSVKDPGSDFLPSDYSQQGPGHTFIRNSIGVGYKISPDLVLGVTPRIEYVPSARDYRWADSYLRLMAPKLVDRGNFSMIGDIRLYAPLARGPRLNGEGMSVMTHFVPNYNFPGTKWSINANLYHQWYARTDRTAPDFATAFAKNEWTSEIYIGPSINYQLTPTVALSVLYEFDSVHVANDDFFSYYSDSSSSNGYTDLEPGISWDITPNVNLNPFLNLYPGSKFNLETANVNVVLGVKFL